MKAFLLVLAPPPPLPSSKQVFCEKYLRALLPAVFHFSLNYSPDWRKSAACRLIQDGRGYINRKLMFTLSSEFVVFKSCQVRPKIINVVFWVTRKNTSNRNDFVSVFGRIFSCFSIISGHQIHSNENP